MPHPIAVSNGASTRSDRPGVIGGSLMSGSSRLLEQVREVIRIKHYSIRTEQGIPAVDQALHT